MHPRTVETEDGVALPVDVHEATGAPWGTVVLLHAMMVDRRSMDRPAGRGLASVLASGGLEVWNCDFRGHGKSGDNGPWTYDDLVYGDIPALVEAAREATGGPVWLMGLSLGGHTSMAAVSSGVVEPAGVVLLSANIWRPGLDPSWRRRIRRHLTMVSFRALNRVVGHYPSRRLRSGPADEAGPYVEDLTRFWFTDRWADSGGLDWTPGLSQVAVPVLSVIGRGDALMAHHVGARAFVHSVPGHVFAHIGRGDLGLAHDPDHIGLGADLRCEPVWRWLVAWMRSV